jgi:hypothetical protein
VCPLVDFSREIVVLMHAHEKDACLCVRVCVCVCAQIVSHIYFCSFGKFFLCLLLFSSHTQCTKIAWKTVKCLSHPLTLLPCIRRVHLRNKSSNLHGFCYWESLHWRLRGEFNYESRRSNVTPILHKAKIEASRFF